MIWDMDRGAAGDKARVRIWRVFGALLKNLEFLKVMGFYSREPFGQVLLLEASW